MSTVSLYRLTKVNGKRKFVRVSLGRGRSLQVTKLSGNVFYLRYSSGDSKRRWQSVGPDLEAAKHAQASKEHELKTAEPVTTIPGQRIRLDDATAVYFANLEKRGLDHKTIQKYRTDVNEFRTSCPKTYVTQITKQDLFDFMGVLRQGEGSSRTQFNKVNNVVVFLKAFGLTRLLKKNEYPSFTQSPVRWYSPDEISRLLAATETSDERFTLRFFLETGMRDGEVAHAEYADLRQGFIHIVEKPKYKLHPKNGKFVTCRCR
jgi:integrase